MKNIPIGEARGGDVIGRDLVSAAGGLILAKGTKLGDSMIARLKKMSVREIVVEGQDEQTAEAVEEQVKRLEARFQGHETDPYMTEMKRVVEEHLRRG